MLFLVQFMDIYAQSLETALKAEGRYETAVLNAENFLGHNHLYKRLPPHAFSEPELTDSRVFKNPLTVFYPLPEAAYPLVIIGHGWGDSKKSNAALARYVASHGYIAVIFSAKKRNYPEEFIAAFKAAYTLAAQAAQNSDSRLYRRINLQKTAVIGHSMGGTAALHFTVDNPAVHTVIALNPYNGASPFIEMIGGKNTVLGTDISGITVPILIFTGTHDRIAYPEKSFEFYKHCNQNIPAAFFSLKDGMHVSPMDKIGNTFSGGFDAEKHARYRILITGWLDLFLKKDFTTASSLYANAETFEAVSKWFASSKPECYPPYLLQNIR